MSDENERPAPELDFIKAAHYDTLKPTLDFIPRVFHDRTVVNMFAPSGSGKTFAAIHFLCSAALGRPVFGNKTEVRNGLYVGLEGEAHIKVRIKAWCAQNGVDRSPIDYALGGFDLGIDKCVNELIEYMKKREIEFVVIDTLAMAMIGMDEISGQHMSVVLDALHKIKRETGACVVVLDHTGKNIKAGERGHSSKRGNVDTSIEIVVENKRTITENGKTRVVEDPITHTTPRSLVIHKQRDAAGGGDVRFRFAFALHETDVIDARGNPMTSLAVDEAEHFKELPPEEDTPRAAPLGPLQKEAADILDRLNTRLGRAGPASLDQVKGELKRKRWGPENPASWRSVYRNLKGRMEFDADGCVISIV